MNRLVQAVTMERVDPSRQDANRTTAAELLEAALPPRPEQPASWSTYHQLVPHVMVLLTADTPGLRRSVDYLENRHAGTTGRLHAAVEQESDPRARLLAVFDAQAEFFSQPGFRGCAFSSATAEVPRGGLIEQAADDYRADIRGLFAQLAVDAGAADPDLLARQLHVLYDGAGMSARMDRDPTIASAVRVAAQTLIDSAVA